MTTLNKIELLSKNLLVKVTSLWSIKNFYKIKKRMFKLNNKQALIKDLEKLNRQPKYSKIITNKNHVLRLIKISKSLNLLKTLEMSILQWIIITVMHLIL